nr:hypothetical protein [Tanacetum cinerariifolium]
LLIVSSVKLKFERAIRETVDSLTRIQYKPRINPSCGLKCSIVLHYKRIHGRNKEQGWWWEKGHNRDATLTFQCPILTSTYYTIWWMRMEVLLGIHGVWDVIDPESEDAKKNNIVKGLLFQLIPKDLVLQIGNLKTRKEMWESIKTHAYVTKLSGISPKSATLGEVMSKHKQVKKFLTSLPRRFVHIVRALEQVLDLKKMRFGDVVGRLKVYQERVKEEDKKDPQENFLYARTEYSNENNDSTEEEDVAQTLEVMDEVEVKDMVGATRKTKVNMTPRNHDDNEQKGKALDTNCGLSENTYS